MKYSQFPHQTVNSLYPQRFLAHSLEWKKRPFFFNLGPYSSPWSPVSVDIFSSLYWVFNFSLSVGLSFLFKDAVVWPLHINPHDSLWAIVTLDFSPFLNHTLLLPTSQCLHVTVSQLKKVFPKLLVESVRFLCSFSSYSFITSHMSLYLTLQLHIY